MKMLPLCLMTGLLGLASAQSSSVVNNWYSANVVSSPAMATSSPAPPISSTTSSTSRAPSASSAAVSSVSTPPAISTPSSAASRSAVSSNIASSSAGTAMKAAATLTPFNNSTVRGTVILELADAKSPTKITYNFSGFTVTSNPKRGVHIHQEPSTDCNAALGHFNPSGKDHGMLNDVISHAGDLGNIMVDSSGNAQGTLTASNVTLFGMPANIVIRRNFVIHNGEDDGGKTGKDMSSVTGNSGIRVACGIIDVSA